MESWDYDRYGQDKTMELSQYANVAQQFQTITGNSFHGQTTDEYYLNMINALVAKEADYHTEGAQLAFGLLGYVLGGRVDTTLSDLVLKIAGEALVGAIDNINAVGATVTGMDEMMEDLVTKYENW